VTDAYEGWAIVELMGHRRLAGKVGQAEQYGTAMLRLDVYVDGDDPTATQFYGAPAIYCVTPTTEQIARAVARRDAPRPVSPWELARPAKDSGVIDLDDDGDDFGVIDLDDDGDG
jgi:hypothetical protein